MSDDDKLIRHSGNYRKLLSYQKADVIYEMTYYFCQHYCSAATAPSTRWCKPHAQASRTS